MVAAQEGRLRLQASDIDALLLGTDLLQRVATPASSWARRSTSWSSA